MGLFWTDIHVPEYRGYESDVNRTPIISQNIVIFIHEKRFFLVAETSGDLYLAAMLGIKFYVKLHQDPIMAFCDLYQDLHSLQGLHRAGKSLLAVLASRLAYKNHWYLRGDAMSCRQNVSV